MQKYLIKENTLAIIGKNDSSIIMENKNSFKIPVKSLILIDESCKYYGSSLKGRREGSNFLLGNNYKVPIIIDEYRETIFFPTSSYNNVDNIWINYKQIEKYFGSEYQTIIIFKNNQKLTIKLSNKIVNRQVLKSSRLESILKSKKR